MSKGQRLGPSNSRPSLRLFQPLNCEAAPFHCGRNQICSYDMSFTILSTNSCNEHVLSHDRVSRNKNLHFLAPFLSLSGHALSPFPPFFPPLFPHQTRIQLPRFFQVQTL